jgi:monofunctional biosynthetic peptidoglycan transglycosylase
VKIITRKILRFAIGIVTIVMVLSVLLILPLRWFNPPTTAFILQDESTVGFSVRKAWVDYSQVSPTIFLALIAAEDQKFPDHYGFDFVSLRKALLEDRSTTRGASTITQQLVKNIYLWPGRSLLRKGVEAWLTVWLELCVSKPRILEIYVNVVEFGPGIYGVGEASRRFFGVKPYLVTDHQASLLAAVLPNPKHYSANTPSDYVVERAGQIRFWMKALGGESYLRRLDR